jgi:hypothetical protein
MEDSGHRNMLVYNMETGESVFTKLTGTNSEGAVLAFIF